MIVIDASTLAKYVLKEVGWRDISEFIRVNKPIYSVDLIIKEVANALWKYVKRQIIADYIAQELINAVIELVDTGVIILEPEEQYISDAFTIALHNGITVYDSLYIAQALKRGTLLTSDKEQASVARKLGISVILM
ncbi:type II toxin-antitoxin system VapC family toxin [Vulcanisaeta sp. JCM 16159]|uniref:type II toxin-antitoxin system VapC family toxin n=1 Tax=Vulcanisaeta sp. JCM 16159 TaxID=1295371 RepID=UPI0006D29CF1|nr:type II toxin-antitoxin system VapC family toxin [Vulcanisaeta sp. JCM 16159]